jgi:hypothetical protein
MKAQTLAEVLKMLVHVSVNGAGAVGNFLRLCVCMMLANHSIRLSAGLNLA